MMKNFCLIGLISPNLKVSKVCSSLRKKVSTTQSGSKVSFFRRWMPKLTVYYWFLNKNEQLWVKISTTPCQMKPIATNIKDFSRGMTYPKCFPIFLIRWYSLQAYGFQYLSFSILTRRYLIPIGHTASTGWY